MLALEPVQRAFACATIWQVLLDGWSIEHLFGYDADDEQQVASFGIYTAIGLGMVREVLVEKHIAVLRRANAESRTCKKKVSFRYDRRLMDKAAVVVWWKHPRLDPGPGRFAPRPLLDVLSKLNG